MTRSRIHLVACLCLAAAAGLLWYGWRWQTAPQPPPLPLENVDAELAQAALAARQEVIRQPYSAAAWGRLGKLLRAGDLVQEAGLCFHQAEQLDPQEPRWPYLRGEGLALSGDAQSAVPYLRRAVLLVERGKADPVAPRLRLAEVLMSVGEYDEAEAQLRRALEDVPDNASVHLDLGLLADARGNWEESREHLMRCRFSPFTQQRACARLATICGKRGDTAGAAEYSQRAASLPPDRPWLDRFVAECMQLGVGKSNRLRQAERLEAQKNFREAVDVFRELAEQDPDYRVYIGLGKNLANTGDWAGAERALQEAIRIAPERAQAYYLLGKLDYARAEQQRAKTSAGEAASGFRAAAQRARQAIERKADHTQAQVLLGLALQALDQKKEAQDAFRNAITSGPDQSEPYLYLSALLVELGQLADAQPLLEQAVKLAGADDSRARAALENLRAKLKGQ